MQYILPRVILGNRGDLASRWSLLRALHAMNHKPVAVSSRCSEDIPEINLTSITYGPLRNLIEKNKGHQVYREVDTVLWGVGLDIQDDSSLAKLLYLIILFLKYRIKGMRIIVLFQGAGPVESSLGHFLANKVLKLVDLFVARDPGTYELINRLNPEINSILGFDAIFLPGLEKDMSLRSEEFSIQKKLDSTENESMIGFNIRQWFHFASSILPYQFSREKYLQRSQDKMHQLLNAAIQVIRELQKENKILLISAYQPGVVPWEDDLHWLAQIKAQFSENSRVILVDEEMSIPTYFNFMSRLDLMIGMRLHSTLIALRFGVPSLNISYTLKGKDIMEHLGLSDNVVALEDFIHEPTVVTQRSTKMLLNNQVEREKTKKVVSAAIEHNSSILRQIFDN